MSFSWRSNSVLSSKFSFCSCNGHRHWYRTLSPSLINSITATRTWTKMKLSNNLRRQGQIWPWKIIKLWRKMSQLLQRLLLKTYHQLLNFAKKRTCWLIIHRNDWSVFCVGLRVNAPSLGVLFHSRSINSCTLTAPCGRKKCKKVKKKMTQLVSSTTFSSHSKSLRTLHVTFAIRKAPLFSAQIGVKNGAQLPSISLVHMHRERLPSFWTRIFTVKPASQKHLKPLLASPYTSVKLRNVES